MRNPCLCDKIFPFVIAGVFLFLLPLSVRALGLSPPEVEIDYLPVGSSYTVSATISRAPEELSGDLNVTVSARKSAASFFHGETSFVIPDGTREITYLYTIIPDYPDAVDQELYVTFLLQPTTVTTSGVGIITGVTQVVRFTTDIVARPGSSWSGSGRSSSDESSEDDATPDEDETSESEETSNDTSDSSDESLSDVPDTDSDASIDAPEPEEESFPTESPTERVQEQTSTPETFEYPSEPPATETDLGSFADQLFAATDIDLQSSTHPSQDTYYAGDGIMLSWLQSGQSKEMTFRYILNQNPTADTSELTSETQNPSIYFSGLPDGIYYFHLLDASDPDGSVATQKIMVDNTPPVVEPSTVSQPSLPLFPPRRFIALEVIDALSGVVSSHVRINGTPVETTGAGIPLRGLGFGQHQLTVQTVDEAGNEQTAEFVVTIRPRFPVLETVHRLLRLPENIFSRLFRSSSL